MLIFSDPAAEAAELGTEIANGRLAMKAIISMFFSFAWGDWGLYIAFPLRAFGHEPGMQVSVGFWDPAGVVAEGIWDPAGVVAEGSIENRACRRRQTEIKHGRIVMFAAMGCVPSEIKGKGPGSRFPFVGLKVADVPNSLAALFKAPAASWGYAIFTEPVACWGQ
eukprot:16016281-Heterocapsa_arctica.AAC.1